MSSLLGFNRVRWTSVDSNDDDDDDRIDEENQLANVNHADGDQVPDISDSIEFREDETASIIDNDDEEEDLEDVHIADDDESAETIGDEVAVATPEQASATPRMTLRELEEERELARRRSSACVLLAVFFLFRLWIEALTQANLGLLMISLMGTSWCARWIRHNREREEELDRRIAAFSQNNQNNAEGAMSPDLRMLSFQAQLALALMESQRQMMQGGFGHPDGETGDSGVADEVRAQWKRLKFKDVKTVDISSGPYDSVTQDEGPSCSICLCEYEPEDELVQLPCGHEYHGECITSWTDAHSKCPLCNLDLESVAESESLP